jgi:hypothetical protein
VSPLDPVGAGAPGALRFEVVVSDAEVRPGVDELRLGLDELRLGPDPPHDASTNATALAATAPHRSIDRGIDAIVTPPSVFRNAGDQIA